MTRKRCRKLIRALYSSDFLTRDELENMLTKNLARFGSYEAVLLYVRAIYYMMELDEEKMAYKQADKLYDAIDRGNKVNAQGAELDIPVVIWLHNQTRHNYRKAYGIDPENG